MTAVDLDWVSVPGGPFTMGSDAGDAYPPDADEAPRHTVAVAAFRLGRTPVTNAQYGAYLADAGTPGRCHAPDTAPHEPVTYVSWEDARAFCDWACTRLPTEAEWERAARGDDERLWPWGDALPDEHRCAFGSYDGPPEVGSTPLGASPYGALDLAGTVWEWTSSAYRPYPYDPADGRERPGSDPRVVRGGSFIHDAAAIRCSARHPLHPGTRDHYVGFRVAAGPTSGPLALDWVDVPAGPVSLGNDPRPVGTALVAHELPQHVVAVEGFELARTPVTNEQYAAYVAAVGAPPPPHWGAEEPPPALEQHPVTYVDWHDARAYCGWIGGRLPSEAEWEKASRGSDGRAYPWGQRADPERLAVGLGLKHGTTAPVGVHAGGASPYGLLDMSGNVWEWVASAYRPYPYEANDGREDPGGDEPRVLRGGSYASTGPADARCASRSRSRPCRRQSHIGFRVARGGGPR